MKKNNLNNILEEIDKYSKIIKESYVFDEEDSDLDVQDGGLEEPSMDGEDLGSNAEDRINQIRTIALDGIQEFSEEVDSDEYNIFKNIWMTCDKFYSAKNKETEDK